MECKVEVSSVVGSNDPITVWSGQSLSLKRRQNQAMYQIISENIDILGKRSQQAQGLNHVLTSTQKLFDFPDQRVYLFATEKQFIGILKIGPKKLFHRTRQGNLVELELLCVLDFYVHESYQRGGIGKALFDTMLEREQRDPATFGYDRPSPKFVAFLRKHFHLADYVPQTNNFVVFDRCFELLGGSGVGGGRRKVLSDNNSGLISKNQQQGASSSYASSASTNAAMKTASVDRAMETYHKLNHGSSTTASNNKAIAKNNHNSTPVNNEKTTSGTSDYQRLRQMETNKMSNNVTNNNNNDQSPQGAAPPSPQKQIPQPTTSASATSSSDIYSKAVSQSQQKQQPSFGLSTTTSSNLNKIGSLLSSSSSGNQQPQTTSSSGLPPQNLFRSTSNPSTIGLGTSTTSSSVYQAAIRGNVSTGVGNFGGNGRRSASSGRFF